MKLEGKLGKNLIIGSLYAPTENASEKDKDAFWRDVKDALQKIGHNRRDVLLIGGDFNGETGKSSVLDNPLIGRWACGKQNGNGLRLVTQCQLEQWCIAATFVKRHAEKSELLLVILKPAFIQMRGEDVSMTTFFVVLMLKVR